MDPLDELTEAARRLLVVDPERFRRVLALCEAYLAIHERGPLPPGELLAWCSLISQGDGRSN